MKDRKRNRQCFWLAFAVTLLICGSLYGFYTAAVNTQSQIQGDDPSVWLRLEKDSGDVRMRLMGEEYALSLAPINEAVKQLHRFHAVIPAEYRLYSQGVALLEQAVNSLLG